MKLIVKVLVVPLTVVKVGVAVIVIEFWLAIDAFAASVTGPPGEAVIPVVPTFMGDPVVFFNTIKRILINLGSVPAIG